MDKAVNRKRPLKYIENSDCTIVSPYQDLHQKRLKFSIVGSTVATGYPNIFAESFAAFNWTEKPLPVSEDDESTPPHDISVDELIDETSDDRIEILNRVNSCLIERINFGHINGGKDQSKIRSYKAVIERLATSLDNAEFLLQVALYARRGLNIRTASNFIIAVAACHEHTKDLIGKYFDAMIITPSDWIEMAQLNRAVNKTISTVLRRAMIVKFRKFDEYQLQKHNKTGKSKSKPKGHDELNLSDDDDREDSFRGPDQLTLKNLIRTLHIKDPAYEVMSILGKNYPKTEEEFGRSRLDGVWSKEESGKRMRLKTAYTWETELSKMGNVAQAWEGLINSRKLPYMAGLRNMRNIFLCDINAESQGKYLNYLKNRNAVERSRQFPFQFFTAYNALSELTTEMEKITAEKEKVDGKAKNAWTGVKYSSAVKLILETEWKGQGKSSTDTGGHQLNFDTFFVKLGISKPTPLTVETINTALKEKPERTAELIGSKTMTRHYISKRDCPTEPWNTLVKTSRTLRYQARQQKDKKLGKLEIMIEKHGVDGVAKSLTKFKKTVNDAMLAAVHNVPPVHGTTLFFINKWKDQPKEESNQKKAGYKPRGVGADLNVQSLVLAASAMISCQDSVFYLYERDDYSHISYRRIELDRKVGLLEMVRNWLALTLINKTQNEATLFDVGCSESANVSTLDRAVFLNEPNSDRFILHLMNYRARFNSKFKSFFIGKCNKKTSTDLVTYVTGCSEQVLRYMAEDGKDNAINQVVSFPARFGIELDEYKHTDCIETVKPRIRDIKVFISSTFTDLKDERQQIVDSLIPALNAELLDDNVRLVPVDIRFPDLIDDGITAIEICLQQLKKSDAVIGLFGNRYGTVPPALFRGAHPSRGLEVLKTFDEDISITECEMRAALAWNKPMIILNNNDLGQSSEPVYRKEKFIALKKLIESNNGDNFVQYGRGLPFGTSFNDNITSFIRTQLLNPTVPNIETGLTVRSETNNSDIFGRKLILNRAKEVVYPGEMTAVYGKSETGKTLFLRYLYDLEKVRGRRVAWYDFSDGDTILNLLESLRFQLGIKIQPGKDKHNLMTSMKSNVTICIDNAEHLQTLSWIGELRSDMSIVFAIRRSVVRPEQFAESVTNWLDLPELNSSDKQSILNAYLGFSAPSGLQTRVHAASDSRFPRFLKLFALGLKRFCHNLTDLDVPSSFSDLGLFLLGRAKIYYGLIVESAIAMLLDGPIQFDDLIRSLQFDANGNEVEIDHFRLLQVTTAMDEWIVNIDDTSTVSLSSYFKDVFAKKISKSSRENARKQRISHYNRVINNESSAGCQMELTAYCNVVRLHLLNGEVTYSKELLNNWTFVKEATKIGALEMLYNTALSFELQHSAIQLKKLLSKYSTLSNETDSFAQFAVEEQLDNVILDLFPAETIQNNDGCNEHQPFRGVKDFLLSPACKSDELVIYSTKRPSTVIHIGNKTFLTVDQKGFIFVTKLEGEDISRINFNYRDISSISYGRDRVLISSSACSSLYNSADWSAVCDLNNTDGPVHKSIASSTGSHFATIHHEKRSIRLWCGKDGKLIWRNVLNHVPSCISFSPGVGRKALEDHHGFDCVALGLWSGQIQILSLLDGKVIGRIHTVAQSSLTDVKYTFINNKPFILAGHANGQIGWYSAKCGTMTAVTPPTQSSITNFVTIKDRICAVSKDSVQIWSNKGDSLNRGIISQTEPHHNKVFAITKIQSNYMVLYKYGSIALFDEQYQLVEGPTIANNIGFSSMEEIRMSYSRKIIVAVLSNLTAQIIDIDLDHAPNLTVYECIFAPSLGSFSRMATIYDGSKINFLVANKENSATTIYTESKQADKSTQYKYSVQKRKVLTQSFVGLHAIDKDEYVYVGQYSIQLGPYPKVLQDGLILRLPHKIVMSACNFTTAINEDDIRLAVGYENTNIEIYNRQLLLSRKLSAGQPFVSMRLIVDLLITSSVDEIRVWSKKKSEIIASKACDISNGNAVVINVKETTDWADEMSLSDGVSLHDIESIVFGTAHGMEIWRPTERTKSFALCCDNISSSTDNGHQLLISKADGIFEWNLPHQHLCHPAGIDAICQINDAVVTACALKLMIWSYDSSDTWVIKRSFELSNVRPIGFWTYCLNGVSFNLFVYYENGNFQFYEICVDDLSIKKIELRDRKWPNGGVLNGFAISGESTNCLTVTMETIEYEKQSIGSGVNTNTVMRQVKFRLFDISKVNTPNSLKTFIVKPVGVTRKDKTVAADLLKTYSFVTAYDAAYDSQDALNPLNLKIQRRIPKGRFVQAETCLIGLNLYGTSDGKILYDIISGGTQQVVSMQVFNLSMPVTKLTSVKINTAGDIIIAATDGFRVNIILLEGTTQRGRVVAFYNSKRKISSLQLSNTLQTNLQILLGHSDGFFTSLNPKLLK